VSGTSAQCVAVRPGLTTGLSSALCTVFMSAKSPKRQHGRSAVKKLDVCKLQDATMQAKLQSSLSEALADSSTDELAHIQENCVGDKCQGDQLPEVALQGLV